MKTAASGTAWCIPFPAKPPDYGADKSYWAFYMNGEYMMTGAGETVLTDGATYAFVRTFEK